MRVLPECFRCLERLTDQTLALCFAQRNISPAKQANISNTTRRQLKRNFSSRTVPAELFSRLNRANKKSTRVPDPFRLRKIEEIRQARMVGRKLYREHRPRRLDELLLFSVRGNSLDFFKPLEESIRHMHEPAKLYAPGLAQLEQKLRRPCRILFFADNSGEIFFDLPLVKHLNRKHIVTYIVKSGAIQNDLTMKDLKNSRMRASFPRAQGTGNDAVGIALDSASVSLKRNLAQCDLVIAKGMGYYETFTELPRFRGKVFHLLMAKCRPVAKSIGVPLHSFVLLKSE